MKKTFTLVAICISAARAASDHTLQCTGGPGSSSVVSLEGAKTVCDAAVESLSKKLNNDDLTDPTCVQMDGDAHGMAFASAVDCTALAKKVNIDGLDCFTEPEPESETTTETAEETTKPETTAETTTEETAVETAAPEEPETTANATTTEATTTANATTTEATTTAKATTTEATTTAKATTTQDVLKRGRRQATTSQATTAETTTANATTAETTTANATTAAETTTANATTAAETTAAETTAAKSTTAEATTAKSTTAEAEPEPMSYLGFKSADDCKDAIDSVEGFINGKVTGSSAATVASFTAIAAGLAAALL